MKKQEVFDTVARHLLTQKRRSYVNNEGAELCCYRGPRGLKCAVGALIPDELYSKDLEGLAVGSGPVAIVCKQLGIVRHLNLLADLQDLHDDVPTDRWYDRLLGLATRHRLSKKVLEEFAA